MQTEYKRKKFLVYPKFQLTLIAINGAILAVVLAVIGYQVFASFQEIKSMGVESNLAENHPYFKFINYHYGMLFQNLILGFAIGILSSSFFTLILSHRLAGPIVRLKSYFESIVEKDTEIKPLKFREQDFFSDLAPVINRSIETLQNGGRNGK